jgi:hypothetical protein
VVVASGKKSRRKLGFDLFFARNPLWVNGQSRDTDALVVLQPFLAVMNANHGDP